MEIFDAIIYLTLLRMNNCNERMKLAWKLALYRPTNLDVFLHYERKILESVLKSSVRVLINSDKSHKENM